jgi:hypothetical protein
MLRSFKVRKKHRLRVFEKRVLRGIFAPKKVEVADEDDMGGTCNTNGRD